MASSHIFIVCLMVLLVTNIVFYTAGIFTDLLTAGGIIGAIISAGLIVVALSMIPTTSGAPALKWLISSMLFIGLFYQISFPILTYNISIGFGLCSNIIDFFAPYTDGLGLLPWLFYFFLGIIGVISGLMMGQGGD